MKITRKEAINAWTDIYADGGYFEDEVEHLNKIFDHFEAEIEQLKSQQQEALQAKSKSCEWSKQFIGYETSCGNKNGISEKDMKNFSACPYCTGKISMRQDS